MLLFMVLEISALEKNNQKTEKNNTITKFGKMWKMLQTQTV